MNREVLKKTIEDCINRAYNNDGTVESAIADAHRAIDELKEKDLLHQLNSLVRDYCLKRDFDKRFPNDDRWFDVQILCTGQKYRALYVRPLLKDSFFQLEMFTEETTKEMFDKAINHYKGLVKGGGFRPDLVVIDEKRSKCNIRKRAYGCS